MEVEINQDRVAYRAKTAMVRYDFSRPVKLALRDLVINRETSVFDYGCGKGSDVEYLTAKGIFSSGWDPHYFDENSKVEADVVNLGYVLNVIESPAERVQVLRDAYRLCRRVLVVAAQRKAVAINGEEHGDGVITKRQTFQKYFAHEELKELISTSVGVQPYASDQCIFYVFKDSQSRIEYLANRYDSTRFVVDTSVPFEKDRRGSVQSPEPGIRQKKLDLFSEKAVAQTLLDFLARRGRMPRAIEFEEWEDLTSCGLSLSAIEKWGLENVDQEKFDRAQTIRKRDCLMFLAMTRLDPNGRPKLTELPHTLQHDIRHFFSSYKEAVEKADLYLYSLGQPDVVRKAIDVSPVGKKLPDSLYVHTSAIPYLPDELQLFIACGKALVGELDGDVIVKIPKQGGAISFLLYKDFDDDPHPELLLSVRADLKSQRVKIRDYSQSDNPPILHRKETFVAATHPRYEEYADITRREESLGLLGRNDIGFRESWRKTLVCNQSILS